MGRIVRIELTNASSTNWCVNHFAIFAKLERVTGIEPASSDWQSNILPLNYTRKFDIVIFLILRLL